MSAITATFHDGRTLSWRDGEIEGSRVLVNQLGPAAEQFPDLPPMPEAGTVKTANWRTDPFAFLALTQLVHPLDSSPRYSMTEDFRNTAPPPEPLPSKPD